MTDTENPRASRRLGLILQTFLEVLTYTLVLKYIFLDFGIVAELKNIQDRIWGIAKECVAVILKIAEYQNRRTDMCIPFWGGLFELEVVVIFQLVVVAIMGSQLKSLICQKDFLRMTVHSIILTVLFSIFVFLCFLINGNLNRKIQNEDTPSIWMYLCLGVSLAATFACFFFRADKRLRVIGAVFLFFLLSLLVVQIYRIKAIYLIHAADVSKGVEQNPGVTDQFLLEEKKEKLGKITAYIVTIAIIVFVSLKNMYLMNVPEYPIYEPAPQHTSDEIRPNLPTRAHARGVLYINSGDARRPERFV